jgi:hypothetical protein
MVRDEQRRHTRTSCRTGFPASLLRRCLCSGRYRRCWLMTAPRRTSLVAAVTPRLAAVHPVGPTGRRRRGGRRGSVLCFGGRGCQYCRCRQAECRSEAKQGKRLSAREVFTHFHPPVIGPHWARPPNKSYLSEPRVNGSKSEEAHPLSDGGERDLPSALHC